MLKNLTESKLGIVDRKNRDPVHVTNRYGLFLFMAKFWPQTTI